MYKKIKYVLLVTMLYSHMCFSMMGLINRSTVLVDMTIKKSGAFFDVTDKKRLDVHISGLQESVEDISSIIRDTCQLFNESQDKSYLALLGVLLPARKILCSFYVVICREYSSAIALGFALKKLINRIKKSGVISEFHEAMIDLELALRGKEVEEFYLTKDAIYDFEIPSNTDCMIALNKYF